MTERQQALILRKNFHNMGRTIKKEKSEFKKAKHGSLGKKADKRHFNEDEVRDIQDAIDPIYWEAYCGACDNFETDRCPFKGKVVDITRWEIDVDCKEFND